MSRSGKWSRRLHTRAVTEVLRRSLRESLQTTRAIVCGATKGRSSEQYQSEQTHPSQHEDKDSTESSDDDHLQDQDEEAHTSTSSSECLSSDVVKRRESPHDVGAGLQDGPGDERESIPPASSKQTSRSSYSPPEEGRIDGGRDDTTPQTRPADEPPCDSGVTKSSAADFPAEILLCIIECSLVGPLQDRHVVEAAIRRGAWAQLREWNAYKDRLKLDNLALVCRGWYSRLAPFLYSKLVEVNTTNIDAVSSALRASDPRTRAHVMHVSIDAGPDPFLVSSRLGRLVPNTLWLIVDGADRDIKPRAYGRESGNIIRHPAQMQVLCRSHSAFVKVALLDLKQCIFPSSIDLLRLLSCFPALVYVDLNNVEITNVSDICPRSRASCIRYIHSSVSRAEHMNVPALVRCFTWPQLPDERTPFGLAGIPFSEASAIALFIQLFEAKYGSTLALECIGNGQTWVISYRTGIFHLEFFAMQDIDTGTTSKSNPPAHIRQLVIRFKYAHNTLLEALSEEDDEKAVSAVIRLLGQLSCLQGITVERQGEGEKDEAVLKKLEETFRFPVTQRTSKEAHELARDHAVSYESGLLMSPWWHLRQYSDDWKFWLPKEYWNALSPAERASWDFGRTE